MARISANKLAEFLVSANPARRRKIVHDQKYPSAAVAARYRKAFEPIARYLQAGRRDASPIDSAVRRFRADREGTDWHVDDRLKTAEALEEFLQLAPRLPLDDVDVQVAPNEAPRLQAAGVEISVRPDFILSFATRGRRYSGAIKLHFTKSEETTLRQQGAQFVGVLLERWLAEHGPGGHVPSPRHCLSVDVFRRAVVAAPGASTRRWKQIEAGCEEVALRWAGL